MTHSQFIRCLPALGAALLMAACGGEGSSTPAAASSSGHHSSVSSSGSGNVGGSHSRISGSSILPAPEQGPRAMAGFANLGDTCHANSALKFLIHSVGPERLKQHLGDFAQRSDHSHREAAQRLVALIESAYSEPGPTPGELTGFFASLQPLPAFAKFPIVGKQQDASEMLQKLWQSFALHELEGSSIALRDDDNAGFRTEGEYWTTLKPTSGDDNLQQLLDRTTATDWQFEPGKGLQNLTVRIDNFIPDTPSMHSNRNFDFNQTVRLTITKGQLTETLTLEPREVVAFHGSDNDGHYVVYAKDKQWVQHNDNQVTALSQMPSIENVRLINFAIQSIETQSATSSEAAPALKWSDVRLRFGSNPREQFPA